MNLSVDEAYFKSQVDALRKKLNECRENGILVHNFEESLNELLQTEEKLLTDLIPYYRVYANNIKKASVKINPVTQAGALSFDGFLQGMLRINKNLFIASSTDGRVQFFHMDITDDFTDCNQLEIEWGPPIREIKETISYIYKLNDKEILLFGIAGGCYLLFSDSFEKISENNEHIKVKKLQTDRVFGGFGRCAAIEECLFAAENGENTLALFEIIKENDEYHLIFHKDICLIIPDWTVLEKIEDDYFAVGTKRGKLFFVRYYGGQFTVEEEIDLLNGEIRKIMYLEDECSNKNSLMAIGNEGQYQIISFGGIKKVRAESDCLKGNLFDIQSQNGTAVILSEDGIVYLFEENFGKWNLNEEAAVNDAFFTNIFKLNDSGYLLMDVEGKLNLLEIDRIHTAEDLWELPLH